MKTNLSELGSKVLSGWAMNQKWVTIGALALGVLVPPLVNKPYITSIAINCMIFTTLCLSLNLITGFMNITSLGHAAFYGVGAYTAAILSSRLGIGFPFTFIAAMLTAAAAGLLLGLPSLHIQGRYLAIITLGFCEITRIIELNWMSLTRGPLGIPNIPGFIILGIKLKPIQRYFVALGMVVFTIYVIHSIMNSRLGRAVAAVRDDQVAAAAIGVPVFRYKLLIFSISSAFAGLAGAFYAHHISFIAPQNFSFDQSILYLSMIILGGMGSIPGSIIGALVLTIIPELMRSLMEYRLIIYGLVIVIMLIIRPSGICGGFNLKHIAQRNRFAADTARGSHG
ncbi:MAG: branched-chain amino acid ABC transporter permease [Spirochaetaceae bacterium]|jgi:branched-chain amino acid transport system permease protein|nr:branched-chain amino acid ABC transporter permease [Spirochaetaceae bacterium]